MLIEQNKIAKQDGLLEMLVGMANSSNMTLGITLLANGQMISGQLTSYSRYLELVSTAFKQVENEFGDAMSKGFDIILNENKSFMESKENEETVNSFLHLTDVTIIDSSTNKSHFENTQIRIKISKITGFFIGNIS